jgi:type IV secretory pathway VirB10-like protein
MKDAIDMSPDASPRTPNEKSGVRRVNNLPIYLIGGVVASFLLIMVLVAADRAEKQNRPPELPGQKAASTASFADQLTGQAKDGIIPAAKASPTLTNDTSPALPAIPLDTTAALQAPPAPPVAAPPAPQSTSVEQDPRVRIQMEKMHMLEEAIKARSGIQAAAPRSAGSPFSGLLNTSAPQSNGEGSARAANSGQQLELSANDDPTTAFQQRLQQLKQAGLIPPSNPGIAANDQQTGSSSQSPIVTSGRNYGQFDGTPQQDRWRLDSQLQAPRTPYELRAGFVLPAILVSGINSDLPGQVIGQVSQDVFDTATGKWQLIPRGSRLVGQYSSDVAYGQARVLVAWQRIIFPDGKALDIGAMPGADSAGYSGFNDKVNNHYLRVFGSALLMSGVTAGIALSQPDELYGNRMSARSAMSEALGQQLGHVTAQMIARNMGIAPTLEIRPGYRFNVVVIKDLTFSKPYKAFDY